MDLVPGVGSSGLAIPTGRLPNGSGRPPAGPGPYTASWPGITSPFFRPVVDAIMKSLK